MDREERNRWWSVVSTTRAHTDRPLDLCTWLFIVESKLPGSRAVQNVRAEHVI